MLNPAEKTLIEQHEDYQKDSAVNEFSACIPEEVCTELSRYTKRRWHLLLTFAHCPGALDLSRSNPALLFMLANNRVFHFPPVTCPMRSTRRLVYRRQRNILEWLGFPATETVRRILAKIEPGALSNKRLLLLRKALRTDPECLTLLRHLPMISRNTLEMFVDDDLRCRLTPSFLQDIYTAELVDPWNLDFWPAQLLRDTLRMCSQTGRDDFPVAFHSVSALQQLHDELSSRVTELMLRKKHELPEDLPAPPFPGTATIVPLTKIIDVVHEGIEQKNCVASYVFSIASGHAYIYRVESPVRGTLSLKKMGSGWGPDQFMLACNTPVPTEVYWAVVRELLQTTVKKPQRQLRQEEFEFSPYFQPFLFGEDEEVELIKI